MNKRFLLICLLWLGLLFNSAIAQETFHKIERENISFEMPEGWTATRLGKKLGDYGIRITENNGCGLVEINCTRKVVEPTSRITLLASERSSKHGFDYMQIDQVNDAKLNKMKAKHLAYTNTFLTEAYAGGIYGIVFEGYTYTIEYYGKDMPKERALIEKILKSVRISKPDNKPTMVEMEERFVPKDWNEVQDGDSIPANTEKEKKKWFNFFKKSDKGEKK